MAKTVDTSIEINAPAEVVWSILTDFDHIAEWNDFIRHVEGERTVGSKLVVEVWLGKRKPMTFKPRLLAYRANRELRWIGRFLVPGLADGEHTFLVEPLSDSRVRLIHRERFGGLLIPLLWGGMRGDLQTSFESMNLALKRRAEAAATEASSETNGSSTVGRSRETTTTSQ